MPSFTREQMIARANADPTFSPYYVSVLYADYGKRKTTTACSMVKEKGLLLSSDDSWKVLRNSCHKEIFDKITVRKLTTLTDLNYMEIGGYDTIIWDTVSKSIDRYLDTLSSEADWNGAYRDKINTKNEELKGTTVLALMDYRVTRDAFRPILDKFFNSVDSHIIFTSQMTTPIPGLGKNQQIRPSIPDATFKIIGERADIIAQLAPGNRGIFNADVSENSATRLGKSRLETIQGQMNLDSFVQKYKEFVF